MRRPNPMFPPGWNGVSDGEDGQTLRRSVGRELLGDLFGGDGVGAVDGADSVLSVDLLDVRVLRRQRLRVLGEECDDEVVGVLAEVLDDPCDAVGVDRLQGV